MYTPLYLACQKGFLGAEGVDSKSPEVMQKRRECVEILLKRGADVNFVSPKLRMTPLHWAGFHGDPLLVQMLLDHGAKLQFNVNDITPVDMAGFMGNAETVRTFTFWLEKKIR